MRGGRLGHRGLGAVGLLPAVGGGVQAVAGQHPGAAHAQLLGDRRDRCRARGRGWTAGEPGDDVRVLGLGDARRPCSSATGGVRRRGVLAGVAGLQAQVLGLGGQQVAGAHVAGAQPLAPRHPLGREQRVGAGQQDRLVERDDLRAGGPGDRHGPAPAAVAGFLALEEVRDDAVSLGHRHRCARRPRRARRPPRPPPRARSTASAHRRSGVRLRVVAALTGIASLLRRLTSAPADCPSVGRPAVRGGRSGPGDRVDVRARSFARAHLYVPFCGIARRRAAKNDRRWRATHATPSTVYDPSVGAANVRGRDCAPVRLARQREKVPSPGRVGAL